MGEMAYMMINGDFCQQCGIPMSGGNGYPRKCRDCRNEDKPKTAKAPAPSSPIKPASQGKQLVFAAKAAVEAVIRCRAKDHQALRSDLEKIQDFVQSHIDYIAKKGG